MFWPGVVTGALTCRPCAPTKAHAFTLAGPKVLWASHGLQLLIPKNHMVLAFTTLSSHGCPLLLASLMGSWG